MSYIIYTGCLSGGMSICCDSSISFHISYKCSWPDKNEVYVNMIIIITTVFVYQKFLMTIFFEILTRLINIQLNFNILNIYTSNNKDICQAKLKIPSTVLYVFFIYISLIQHGYLVGLFFFCLIKFKLVSLTFDSISA